MTIFANTWRQKSGRKRWLDTQNRLIVHHLSFKQTNIESKSYQINNIPSISISHITSYTIMNGRIILIIFLNLYLMIDYHQKYFINRLSMVDCRLQNKDNYNGKNNNNNNHDDDYDDQNIQQQQRKHSTWLLKNGKTLKQQTINKQQFMLKNYGQIELDRNSSRSSNKQWPPRGSIASCSIDCFVQTDCHCIEINKQNGNCRTYGYQDRQPYLTSNNETNFIYYTRDYFGPSQKRVDISDKSKQTSDPKGLKYEFKNKYYIIGFSFIAQYKSIEPFAVHVLNNDQKQLEKNPLSFDNICYQYNNQSMMNQKSMFNGKKMKNRKWFRCQPCGLYGNTMIFSAIPSNSTTNSNVTDSSASSNDNWKFMKSLRIYGY